MQRLWLFDKKNQLEYSWERHLVAAVTAYDAVTILAVIQHETSEAIHEGFTITEIPMVGVVYSDIY